MRFDLFLRTVGIVKRRSEATRLLKEGRVQVDGRVAKPALAAAAGQHVRVDGPRSITEWEVLEVPPGNVPKSEQARYAVLRSETPRKSP